MTMPRLPRKKKGIADMIREKGTMKAASDDTRVARPEFEGSKYDTGLADRVEKRIRDSQPDELEHRYGKLKSFAADDGLADDLKTANRNLKKYGRR